LRLQGQLELRVDDWVDYDELGNVVDNRVVEMGWFFRESNSDRYDGVKAKFLYNSTYNNNPKQLAFQRIFKLDDMYDVKLDINS